MMTVSACMICWNEEEMLALSLPFLESLEHLTEICVLDSFSTDRSWVMLNEFKAKSTKVVKIEQRAFTNFCEQRNANLAMASGNWILYIDADETYTGNIDKFLAALPAMCHINAVRVPTMLIFPDRRHYLENNNNDPHIRLWRRGFAHFENPVHECLIDAAGRSLHCIGADDIYNTTGGEFDVWMKHHQLLKSVNALSAKGTRWDEIGAIRGSQERGIPIYPGIWVKWKENVGSEFPVKPLPEIYRDATTDG